VGDESHRGDVRAVRDAVASHARGCARTVRTAARVGARSCPVHVRGVDLARGRVGHVPPARRTPAPRRQLPLVVVRRPHRSRLPRPAHRGPGPGPHGGPAVAGVPDARHAARSAAPDVGDARHRGARRRTDGRVLENSPVADGRTGRAAASPSRPVDGPRRPRLPRTVDARGRRHVAAGIRAAGGRGAGRVRAATSIVGVLPALAKVAYDGVREQHLTLPLQSPPTMLNVPVGRARKLAARSWPIRRLVSVATAASTTINAVVLAMCSGALRRYLLEQYALPDAPLTAMLPVPLDLGGTMIGPRGRDHGVGAMVVGLATDEADPAARLARISESVEHTNRVFGALSHTQFQLMSALAISPILLEPVRRFVDDTPPPFNVMISYMPGPSRPRYWNGARLDAVYPAPTVLGGQALSITLTSRSGQLDVGVVGDRHAVPHLQRIITHLETSLSDLEHAVAASGT
ncbi:LOW QUALITY PROTEIN: bifunctional wax ester synthase:acyl-CoAdiacylglycerol acyltransferase, partial [Rhodococcus opacus PD630]